jgi:hypothetical protein
LKKKMQLESNDSIYKLLEGGKITQVCWGSRLVEDQELKATANETKAAIQGTGNADILRGGVKETDGLLIKSSGDHNNKMGNVWF